MRQHHEGWLEPVIRRQESDSTRKSLRDGSTVDKGNRESIAPPFNRAEEFNSDIFICRSQTLSEPNVEIGVVNSHAIRLLTGVAHVGARPRRRVVPWQAGRRVGRVTL